jgi:hypothetical protein
MSTPVVHNHIVDTSDLTPENVEKLMEDFMVWVLKCDEMKKLATEAVGEVKEAYALVHKDYLWKLQSRAGRLWYYVCGVQEMNPFELKKAGE